MLDDKGRGGDRAAFYDAFEEFSAAYPGGRLETRHREAYWMALQLHSLADVVEAFKRAPIAHPRFPATAGEVAELAKLVVTERQEKRRQGDAEYQDMRARRQAYAHVPKTAPAQEAYVSEASKPGERLARYFECESVGMNLAPLDRTPDEVAARRIKAIHKLLAGKLGVAA